MLETLSLPSVVFYGLAGATVACAIAVVTLRNVFYSALALVGALTFIAGFFILLGADFLAAAQVLVYVGGIMIIMLFVVMLSQQAKDQTQRQTNDQWLAGLCFSLAIAITLIKTFRPLAEQAPASREIVPTSANLGRLLLGEMVLPFEAVSLILLAALVGAVFFAQEKTS